MTQIAYATEDGAIYETGLDAQGPRSLTPEGTKSTWPTWSADGRYLAFSGLRSGTNGLGQIAVYVKGPGESEARPVYTNEPGTDAIARKTPHYALWSPDGRRLSFIAQTWKGGLTLFVHDTTEGGEASSVVSGGPLYMSWSPDSRFLLVHSSQFHHLVDFEDNGKPRRMPGVATQYMAPSWSPAGNAMALLRDAGAGRQNLMLGSTDGESVRAVAEVDGRASFAWSPDGKAIALGRDPDAASGYYAGLWLVDVEAAAETRIVDGPLLCFFWSPDATRLAYVAPSEDAEGSVRWAVVSVDGGAEPRYLADFQPTQEQLTMFMFFDQYGQSHSPWSPDGSQIVFSGTLGRQAVRVPLPEGDTTSVFVADAGGEAEPQRIAQGFIGVWSPN